MINNAIQHFTVLHLFILSLFCTSCSMFYIVKKINTFLLPFHKTSLLCVFRLLQHSQLGCCFLHFSSSFLLWYTSCCFCSSSSTTSSHLLSTHACPTPSCSACFNLNFHQDKMKKSCFFIKST